MNKGYDNMSNRLIAMAAAGLFGAAALAAPNDAQRPSFLRASDTWVLSGSRFGARQNR